MEALTNVLMVAIATNFKNGDHESNFKPLFKKSALPVRI